MDPIVRFDSVSKLYFLGSRRAYAHYMFPGFVRRWRASRRSGHEAASELWALQDVSFEVQPGEVVGLIGQNGAGKTTALSLLAGITSPTHGQISVRGRIGALIQLGAGFHPELTGRENVFLNAAILGLHKSEVAARYDEIVNFADLGPFMETPVKRYSSGMFVRLGFAVAVHINPEILLVDEVLSVGDVAFQAKCFNKIGELRRKGTTILMVSHNTHTINSFCNRVIYLKRGRVVQTGDPDSVMASYLAEVMHRQDVAESPGEDASSRANGTGRLLINSVEFLGDDNAGVKEIQSGNNVTVRIHYRAVEPIENPILDLVIRDAAAGNMFQATNRDFGVEFGRLYGDGKVDVRIRHLNANNQLLNFFLAFWDSDHIELLDWKRHIALRVEGNMALSGRLLYDCSWAHEHFQPSSLPDAIHQTKDD